MNPQLTHNRKFTDNGDFADNEKLAGNKNSPKRTHYYHDVFKRTNHLKVGILSFFLMLASWPRLLLEVFVRKNFGERYFSVAAVITLFGILAFFPMVRGFARMTYYGGISFWANVTADPTWYMFLVAFLIASFFRYREVKRNPSVFDFARFSLSQGEINPAFHIKALGDYPNPRTISTVLEPAFFFIIGLVLLLFKQDVGVLIMVCSVFYGLSYYGSYYMGDQYLMDKIDEVICSEELGRSFIDNLPSSETRGFEAQMHRPANAEFRRKLVDNFLGDDNEPAEAY